MDARSQSPPPARKLNTVSKSQPVKNSQKPRELPPESGEAKLQSDRFNRAMELFHARELRKARDLFEQAAAGPSREMAFSAKMHQKMCEQRLEKQAPAPQSAEDHYAYGVALTNERRFDEARKHLEQALKMREADHYHYALALATALSGDVTLAAKHLARAIEMRPQNRAAARNDSDFAAALQHPALQALLA